MSALALAVLGPFAGAAAILLLRRGAGGLALVGAATGLGGALWLLARVAAGGTETLILPGLPGMPLRLLGEPLAAVLSVLAAGVGALVLVYAVGYMREEAGQARFFALMSLFLAAMQLLVLAGDWVLLLAAWELIGLCSYLLIGFWFEKVEAASAATRAFLYTRTADLGLYLAVFLLVAQAGSSEIAVTLETGGTAAVAAGLLLLLAAMGKSAQTPLQGWLLGAMAGPTPVSALLHSATLVAAGAILMIRTAPMLPAEALLAVGLAGGVTVVVTGLMALAEADLKRLLAASTASQYGLMLIAVGAGAPVAALLHLIAHAAIKSALFLGAGVFQHARGGTGLDRLEGVGRTRPYTFAGFALAALALVGLPPLSGFFSKDAVIAASLAADNALLLAPLALAGTLLTGAYIARALRRLWRGTGEDRPVIGAAWMGAGLAGLALAAAVLGLVFGPLEHLLQAQPPGGSPAIVLGLAATLGGLALGWWVPARRLLGPVYAPAARGFVLAGGLSAWVPRWTLAVAAACERMERGLYAAASATGGLARAVSRSDERMERRLYAAALATGRLGMLAGRLVRRGDERRIDGLIFATVNRIRALAAAARGLQSGLVHRELAISVAGIALMLGTLAWAAVQF